MGNVSPLDIDGRFEDILPRNIKKITEQKKYYKSTEQNKTKQEKE